MIEGFGHLKAFAFLGAMLSFVAHHGESAAEHHHHEEMLDFHDDPVPGDTFPYYIFPRE